MHYKLKGWQECVSISAIDTYFHYVPFSEHIRVIQLEPFDEWEEFHLKCCHYSLVIASQGNLTNWSHLYRSAYRFIPIAIGNRIFITNYFNKYIFILHLIFEN